MQFSTFYNFVFISNFLSVHPLRRYEFLNKCLFTFFLHENRDGHIAGLIEAKPEALDNICPNRKDVPCYVLQFCIHANFLSVQSLRRYEFFNK